jgi:hypothetical protein
MSRVNPHEEEWAKFYISTHKNNIEIAAISM